MKIIYLNCWNGTLQKDIVDFLLIQHETSDIFCLQEVSVSLENEIIKKLKDFAKVDNRSSLNPFSNRLVVLVRRSLDFKTKKNDFIQLYFEKYSLSVINIHGVAQPDHKLDTKERINLSKEIIKFCNKSKHAIIGGDFNLMPRTKSIKILEENGFKNLIKEFKIKRTRNTYAWEQAEKLKKLGIITKYYKKQQISDYCFVSKDIKVKSFEVPDVGISDHLPLILEFEV